MNFVIKLPISTNLKSKTNDLILVIVNELTKMIYYKPIKVTINTPGLVEVIIKAVIQYDSLVNSIVSD